MVEYKDFKNTEIYKNAKKKYLYQNLFCLIFSILGCVLLFLLGVDATAQEVKVEFVTMSITVSIGLLCVFGYRMFMPLKICKVFVSNKKKIHRTEQQVDAYYVIEYGTKHKVEKKSVYDRICREHYYLFLMRGKKILDIVKTWEELECKKGESNAN